VIRMEVGVPTVKHLLAPNGQYQWPIHPQSGDRGPPSRGEPNQTNFLPPEMIAPLTASRIKEWYFPLCPGIDRRSPGTLAERAGHIGEGQVLSCRSSP